MAALDAARSAAWRSRSSVRSCTAAGGVECSARRSVDAAAGTWARVATNLLCSRLALLDLRRGATLGSSNCSSRIHWTVHQNSIERLKNKFYSFSCSFLFNLSLVLAKVSWKMRKLQTVCTPIRGDNSLPAEKQRRRCDAECDGGGQHGERRGVCGGDGVGAGAAAAVAVVGTTAPDHRRRCRRAAASSPGAARSAQRSADPASRDACDGFVPQVHVRCARVLARTGPPNDPGCIAPPVRSPGHHRYRAPVTPPCSSPSHSAPCIFTLYRVS